MNYPTVKLELVWDWADRVFRLKLIILNLSWMRLSVQ